MSNNYEVIFNHNQKIIAIQVDLKEIWKDIIKKYVNKSGINIKTVYFIYSGNKIDEKNSLDRIINSNDKKLKKMNIFVNDIERTTLNKTIINSKEIICPICKESIKMKIKEYKINLYDCKNGHNKNNILLDGFNSTQKIDESEIKCGICQNGKSKTHNNIFYKCNKCKINICPICKSIHDKAHNIINYEQKIIYVEFIMNHIYFIEKHVKEIYVWNVKICIKIIKRYILEK